MVLGASHQRRGWAWGLHPIVGRHRMSMHQEGWVSSLKQAGQGRASTPAPATDGTAANGNVWRQQRGGSGQGEGVQGSGTCAYLRTTAALVGGMWRAREGEVQGPRAACEAEAGNVQRAERVHVRDCRAQGEGQLGREGQGTESCGMPDAAAASAGWSHGHTVYGPAWRAPPAAGDTEEVHAIGWRAAVSLRGSRENLEGLW